jgi:glycosyltransferase involved in cell wall biosynthesis
MRQRVIDVILPTQLRNIDWLEESIESVASQPEVNKIIISLDSLDVKANQNARNKFKSNNIIFIQSVGQGVASTLNTALREATSPYIARQDDDDISLPERFKVQLDFLEGNSYDMCFSSVKLLYPDGTVEENKVHLVEDGELWKPILSLGSALNHPTLFSRNFYKSENIFYSLNIRAEDFALWLSLANQKKIGLKKECLYLYRNHSDQVTKKWNWADTYSQLYPFWAKFCEDISIPQQSVNIETFNYIFNINQTAAGHLGSQILVFDLLQKLNSLQNPIRRHYLDKLIIRIADIFKYPYDFSDAPLQNLELSLGSEFTQDSLWSLMRDLGELKGSHDELGRVGHELQLINQDLRGKLEHSNKSFLRKIRKRLAT